MSRSNPSARRPSRRDTGAPAPKPSPATVVAADLPFRLAVDDALAALREERARDGAAAPGAVAPGSPPAGTHTATVPVTGMTCRTCEVRIQKHVGRLPTVRRVTASAARGQVEIESTAPVSPAAVERAIRAAGYEIGRTPWLANDADVWLTAIGGIALVAVVALLAAVTGVAELLPTGGDIDQGGIVVALLLGLAAGVSTCIALVGGVVLALSASFQASRAASGVGDGSVGGRLRPALSFVLGRIAGYAVFGAALGVVGAAITLPPQATAILMVVVAVVMTILGARLTGLSPRIAAWSPTLPLGIGRTLGLTDGGRGTYSDGRAAALGAASFFLPCGFTQAVQVYALSTGSPAVAAALLAAFAIGTAPGLLGLAGLPAVVPGRMRPPLLRLVGVVVLAFAFVNASSGLQLAGITIPSFGTAAAALPPAEIAADGTQTLVTQQDAFGYSPANVSIYAGVPTRWTIESIEDRSCAIFLVVPQLGIQVRLQKGPNTIDLPALPAGTVSYSCSMGMYGGRITVVDRPAGSSGGTSGAGVAGGSGGVGG